MLTSSKQSKFKSLTPKNYTLIMKSIFNKPPYTLFFHILFGMALAPVHGQQSSEGNPSKLFTADVKEIMDLGVQSQSLEIVSASKKAEKLFDAPLGVSAVTRDEIINSGVLSLPEALRLLPGIIVRETTAGNYDISIRGLSNVPPSSTFIDSDNSISLVMINNRPVYNYFSGGTFWETLPIEINDIERIELVRGPSAALYGPNALTGVINIITREMSKQKTEAKAQIQYGNHNSLLANASLGYRFNDKFHLITSTNVTERYRHSTNFYDPINQNYTDRLDTLRSYQIGDLMDNVDARYPDPNISLKKFGINAFMNYKVNDHVDLSLSTGLENSQSIRPYAENTYTPLSTNLSETKYLDLASNFHDGTFQVSYLNGEQQPGILNLGSHYDFETIDALIDYNFGFGNFTIKPGLNYRRATYNDIPYFGDDGSGIINAKRDLTTLAASLRAEYQLGGLRLISAVRGDKFSAPDDTFLSYQFIANYKIKQKHIFRLLYGKAIQGAFIVNSFTNYSVGPHFVPSEGVYIFAEVKGDPTLAPLQAISSEFGYRWQINKNLGLDLEVFQTQTEGYSKITQENRLIFGENTTLHSIFSYRAMPMKASQTGLTVSIDYVINNKLHFKPFLTYQKTSLEDFSPYTLLPESDPTGEQNISILADLEEFKGTPSMYGGLYLNYRISRKFNLNLNSYYFSNHELTHISDIQLGRPVSPARIDGKVVLNAKFSYIPSNQFSIFINGRNLLFKEQMEYFYTDNIGTTIMGGVSFDF